MLMESRLVGWLVIHLVSVVWFIIEPFEPQTATLLTPRIYSRTLAHRADVAPLHTQASQMPVTEAYAMDVMTVPAGLAGLPGLTVPVAVDAMHGLPLGLQLLGPRFSERCV